MTVLDLKKMSGGQRTFINQDFSEYTKIDAGGSTAPISFINCYTIPPISNAYHVKFKNCGFTTLPVFQNVNHAEIIACPNLQSFGPLHDWGPIMSIKVETCPEFSDASGLFNGVTLQVFNCPKFSRIPDISRFVAKNCKNLLSPVRSKRVELHRCRFSTPDVEIISQDVKLHNVVAKKISIKLPKGTSNSSYATVRGLRATQSLDIESSYVIINQDKIKYLKLCKVRTLHIESAKKLETLDMNETYSEIYLDKDVCVVFPLPFELPRSFRIRNVHPDQKGFVILNPNSGSSLLTLSNGKTYLHKYDEWYTKKMLDRLGSPPPTDLSYKGKLRRKIELAVTG